MYETLSGQKIGRLTIGEEFKKNGKIYYSCECECGNIKDILRSSLLKGRTTSCGCYSRELVSSNTSKDYTNQTFGKLQAVKRLPKYKNNKTFYECKCECGNSRIVVSGSLTMGKVTMCKECAKIESRKKIRKDYTGQTFGKLKIEEMIYEDGKTKALCKCECGNTKKIILPNVINGHTQSCGCYEKESRYDRKHLIDITGQKFGKLVAIAPTERRASNGAVYWECLCDCGNTTYVVYTSLKKGDTQSCGCKKSSKWEEFIRSYLETTGIKFIMQQRFENCKNIQGTDTLPFDFYIPSMKIAIEYDGEHHFKPIPYWGGEEKFIITQRNDAIKNNYCINNNIKLLRLPYTLTEEEIIKEIQNILNP